MPRIKRWFPVSHEFLDDPETSELRSRFGDQAIFMWLRMLSWADRNEGWLRGGRAWVAENFGRGYDPAHPNRSRTRALLTLEWMEGRGWVQQKSGGIYISNYAKYHKTREPHQIPVGNQVVPPPSEPSEPSEPAREKRRSSEGSKQLATATTDPASPHPSASEDSEETEEGFAHAKSSEGGLALLPTLSKHSGYSETALMVYEIRKEIAGDDMDRVLPNKMLGRIEEAVAGHLREEVAEVYRAWIEQGYEPRYFGWLKWLEQDHIPGRKQAAQWHKSKAERDQAKRGCLLCDETGIREFTDTDGKVKTYRCTHRPETGAAANNGGSPHGL